MPILHSLWFYEGRRFEMRKIENDLGWRKRSSISPFRTTLEGPLIDRYRMILLFFIIGCLATFLISGVRDVYGADISLPVRLDFGSVPVRGSLGKKFRHKEHRQKFFHPNNHISSTQVGAAKSRLVDIGIRWLLRQTLHKAILAP